ncbi:hypothetical protein IscW_ISCW019628 [Ixodes scapularis]|uniref:Uncharacterized protein n=1 Tax=Ixodes scapularis TaxID=6945 RepID=B7PUD7_IXOSC|nr:hypothetical protein IscW_ISCW019628 [Ixodes scapularis]|eukprot:XP_002405959.1 hypothetical protein IscW_ISCW019628 [Ixodes scapularis]
MAADCRFLDFLVAMQRRCVSTVDQTLCHLGDTLGRSRMCHGKRRLQQKFRRHGRPELAGSGCCECSSGTLRPLSEPCGMPFETTLSGDNIVHDEHRD